jgi:8-oxo-dGTP pyrophosphatase MutT (NUDIX family)
MMMPTVVRMPPSDDTTARVPLGPIGHYVIQNLEQLRRARKLSYRELSDRLRELGRPIPTLGLSRIEKGTRRVDADDLVALAIALRVNPAALLLPRTGGMEEQIELTPNVRRSMLRAWRWMDGAGPLPEGEDDRVVAHEEIADFAAYARPQQGLLPDAVAELVKRYTPSEERELQPVAVAIVTSRLGVLVGRRHDGKPPWTFIAGGVEPGEDAPFAAGREVKEETGLEIEPGEEIGRRVHPRTQRTMIYIAAKPVRPDDLSVFVGDERELAEVRWVSLAEADELMASYGMFEPVHEHLAQEIGE